MIGLRLAVEGGLSLKRWLNLHGKDGAIRSTIENGLKRISHYTFSSTLNEHLSV